MSEEATAAGARSRKKRGPETATARDLERYLEVNERAEAEWKAQGGGMLERPVVLGLDIVKPLRECSPAELRLASLWCFRVGAYYQAQVMTYRALPVRR